MDSEGDATGALRELSAKGHGCFRPQGLFHELAGGGVVSGKPRLRSCGRCKSKSPHLCYCWIWGQKETKMLG